MWQRTKEDIKRINRIWWIKEQDEQGNFAFRRNRKPCSCAVCSPGKVLKYKSKQEVLNDIILQDNLLDII